MRTRVLGWLLTVTCIAFLAALYQDYQFEQAAIKERTAAFALDRQLAALNVALADFRAAQAGYVAAGQDSGVWITRAAALSADIDTQVAVLRSETTSDDARAHYEAAAAALVQLNLFDSKARGHLGEGERSSAADIIFADALNAGRKLDAELAAARDIELALSSARLAKLTRWRLGANGATVAVAILVMFVLYRGARAAAKDVPAAPAVEVPAAKAASPAAQTELRLEAPLRLPPAVKLTEAADVCVDLARVLDARDVPPLLARASDALGALGVILWVADSTSAALHPSLSHGYPDKVLQRLGALPAAADNPTSIAFRTMRAQVVNGRTPGAHGALAVPLITSAGCVGVLAAEIQSSMLGTETVAVARLLAAQLATFITPVAAAAAPPKAAEA